MIGNSRARFRDRDYHPLMLARVSIIALLVACLVGCASTPPPPAGVGLFRLEDQGYSLLYNLMESESKVGDIFILKPADASLETLVRDIGIGVGIAALSEEPPSEVNQGAIRALVGLRLDLAAFGSRYQSHLVTP